MNVLATGDITPEARAFLEANGATVEYGSTQISIIYFPDGTKVHGEDWAYYVDLPGIKEQEGENGEWFTPGIFVNLDIDSSDTKVEFVKK